MAKRIKIPMTKVSASFPFVRSFEDLFEIADLADNLTAIFPKSVRSAETGFDQAGRYWAIFYIGRKPAKPVINQLLNDANFVTLFVEESDVA